MIHRSGYNSVGSLRLVRDESDLTAMSTSGRLEIYLNGEWGTVCGLFNQEAAGLACRQLGFAGVEQFRANLRLFHVHLQSQLSSPSSHALPSPFIFHLPLSFDPLAISHPSPSPSPILLSTNPSDHLLRRGWGYKNSKDWI